MSATNNYNDVAKNVGGAEAVKSILIAVITIALCVGIVIGGTYAVFTNSTVVENHLVAGNLDVKLERIALYKTALDGDGLLVENDPDYTVVDFSGSNKSNLLGFSATETIVPGVNCKADLKVTNVGNIAVDYTIKVVTKGDENGAINDLAQQMVFYATVDGVTVEKTLAEIGKNGHAITGAKLLSGASAKVITIGVKFVDYDAGNNPDPIKGTTNNKAQNQNIYFDIVIEAVQSTNK